MARYRLILCYWTTAAARTTGNNPYNMGELCAHGSRDSNAPSVGVVICSLRKDHGYCVHSTGVEKDNLFRELIDLL
jgi:hypothetical protein